MLTNKKTWLYWTSPKHFTKLATSSFVQASDVWSWPPNSCLDGCFPQKSISFCSFGGRNLHISVSNLRCPTRDGTRPHFVPGVYKPLARALSVPKNPSYGFLLMIASCDSFLLMITSYTGKLIAQLVLLSTPAHMHGGLICIAFCLSVGLSLHQNSD